MVRSAQADRKQLAILLTTGCTRGYSKLDPPRRTLSKSTLTDIDANKEYSFSTKLVSKPDPPWWISPPWWIKSCIAPGIPAGGRYTRGKMVTRHHPIRRGGLNISGN